MPTLVFTTTHQKGHVGVPECDVLLCDVLFYKLFIFYNASFLLYLNEDINI